MLGFSVNGATIRERKNRNIAGAASPNGAIIGKSSRVKRK